MRWVVALLGLVACDAVFPPVDITDATTSPNGCDLEQPFAPSASPCAPGGVMVIDNNASLDQTGDELHVVLTTTDQSAGCQYDLDGSQATVIAAEVTHATRNNAFTGIQLPDLDLELVTTGNDLMLVEVIDDVTHTIGVSIPYNDHTMRWWSLLFEPADDRVTARYSLDGSSWKILASARRTIGVGRHVVVRAGHGSVPSLDTMPAAFGALTACTN